MDPKLRSDLAKEGRLWGLGVVCAIPGAIAATYYQSWWAGFAFFLVTFAILGGMLLWWTRRRRRSGAAATPPPAEATRTRPGTSSVNQRYGQRKRHSKGPR